MKVMKFGGGCFKSPEALAKVIGIIESQNPPIVVVVSALYGVTDMILNGIRAAKENDSSIGGWADSIFLLHADMMDALLKDQNRQIRVRREMRMKIREIKKILTGISYTGEVTSGLKSVIVSTGERLASMLLAALLDDRGLKAVPAFSEEIGLVTDEWFDNATALMSETKINFQRSVVPLVRKGIIPVVTGFYGVNRRGKVTTFGRNGSDYSAAVIARVLHAEALELWKDVEGFMSADPEVVVDTVKIDTLSYPEAAELSYFGAKLIHPRSLEPLSEKAIPVRIANIHRPQAPPTTIFHSGPGDGAMIKSVTCNQQIAVIGIHGSGVGVKPGIIARIADRLARYLINITTIITSQTCINLILDSGDASLAMKVLKEIDDSVIENVVLKTHLALIAVVGDGLLSRVGVAASVFSAVSREQINIEMISAGASEVATYFIVKKNDVKRAVRAIHGEFFQRQNRA